jgi:hypothetical protein
MHNDQDELVKRLDRIEHKLDIYLERITTHEADLNWVRGYIKLSVGAILSLMGGLATVLLKIFTGV